MLLGYLMDQNIKVQDATKKPVTVIPFADYGVNMIVSGVITHNDIVKDNPDLVRRFMRASTRAFEEAEKNPDAAVDAMLKANAKAGVRESLIVGLKLTTPLYRTPETAKQRPFRVSPKVMTESFNMLVDFGGLDKSAGKVEDFYTNDFLPQ